MHEGAVIQKVLAVVCVILGRILQSGTSERFEPSPKNFQWSVISNSDIMFGLNT